MIFKIKFCFVNFILKPRKQNCFFNFKIRFVKIDDENKI